MRKKAFNIALDNITRDGALTIRNFKDLSDFIRRHRLWEGVMHYTWLSKFLIITGIIGSLAFITFIFRYWSEALANNPLTLSSVGSALGGFFAEGYDLFVIGGLKYVILILMEVVIFHFARRTLEIKTGQKNDTSIKTFIGAQVRMVKVAIYSFCMESILSIFAGIILSMLGFSIIKPAITLLIQSYFLGFAVVDNYNEIYHMTIRQSSLYTLQYASVSLIIGLIVYVIMLVPLAGSIVGPLIGAVVATLTMYELHRQDDNMAWIFTSQEK
jgi:uncharacterized protein YqgC (DUF456 family)